MSIPDNEIIDHLKSLGFTEYEARIYMETLHADGTPKTAYEISKMSGVPRSNTYNALEALVRKGAVLPVIESPASYIAAAPRDMLRSIAAQTSQLCDRVADYLKDFTPRTQNQYVWLLNGEDSISAKIDQLLASSRSSIWIKASDTVLRKHAAALKKAARRKNVRIMIILFGKVKSEFEFSDNCEVYVHENDGTRMGKADNLFTIVVDLNEMVTVNTENGYIGAHTRSKLMVTMALSLIRHDYYMAEIFKKFGEQITHEFGPYISALRLNAYTPDQAQSFYDNTGLAP